MSKVPWRFAILLGCSGALLAGIALLSRVVFSDGTYSPNFRFLIVWFFASCALIAISAMTAVVIERIRPMRRRWSHALAALALTASTVPVLFWGIMNDGLRTEPEFLAGEFVAILGIWVIASAAAAGVRQLSKHRSAWDMHRGQ